MTNTQSCFRRVAFAITTATGIVTAMAQPRPARAQGAPSPAAEIAGRWSGTSDCIKADWNAACNDERVVYFFERKPDSNTVVQHAYKYVGARLELMGDLDYTYDTAAKTWVALWSNDRFRLRWSLQLLPHGVIVGRLLDLGAGRIARTIMVRRDVDQTRPPGP